MANKRITELNLHTSPQLSDVIPIVNSNETKKIAYGSLYNDIRDGLVSGSSQVDITQSQNYDTVLTTSSLDDHTITFTKGDGSTYSHLLPGGQGSPSTNHYLVPEILTISAGQTYNINSSPYDSTAMIYVKWSGGSGTAVINLPDATAEVNQYRALRFVMNGNFTSNTKAQLTPTGGQTLDGGGFYELKKAYEGIMVWSDGSNWIRVQTKA